MNITQERQKYCNKKASAEKFKWLDLNYLRLLNTTYSILEIFTFIISEYSKEID